MDIKEYNTEVARDKQNHPWEYARFDVVLDLIGEALRREGGRDIALLADIGCGDAFFVSQLAKHFAGCRFYAVDTAFTPSLVATLEKRYADCNIAFCSDISEIRLSDNDARRTFDVILLLDVIEHVENDVDFLASLQSIAGFGTETLVVVTVPAYASLYCSHDKWLGHYRRYTEKLLIGRMQQTGFTPLSSGYFFTGLLLPRILQKFREKLFGVPQTGGIGKWQGGKFATSTVKNILTLDYKLSRFLRKAGIKLPGLSCYCIVKKYFFL
jgi:cyclopropane fatty-acyl-phospholipid synthase-like methyltransferase